MATGIPSIVAGFKQSERLSDFTSDIAPLFAAVQLVRLRDRAKGTANLDYGEWLATMDGPEREIRKVAEGVAKEKRKQRGGRKAPESETIGRMLPLFERDFSLWAGIFARETATVAKFLNVLADLRLNVSPELEELKSLRQRNDYAAGRIEGFTKRLRAAANGERAEGLGGEFPIYSELLSIADSLEKLKARVDEKSEDAVRLVSLMTPSVGSQSLIDLLTGEP